MHVGKIDAFTSHDSMGLSVVTNSSCDLETFLRRMFLMNFVYRECWEGILGKSKST